MECCYPVECGEYSVAPMLMPTHSARRYCEQEPPYYPRLPRCPKPTYYCCEMKPGQCPPQPYDCCVAPPQKTCCPQSYARHEPCQAPSPPALQQDCDSCGHHQPPCNPVKTKYIMPCYRYEDGRIANQPTVLMRRACEVALKTHKRKPFVVSSYAADPHNEIRRFHSEDERGNCCYHFERKKPPKCDPCCAPPKPMPCQPYEPHCPECQYVDCVYAHPVETSSCCHYSR